MLRTLIVSAALLLMNSPLAHDQRSVPAAEVADSVLLFDVAPAPTPQCCKVCRKGKACGDTCIARDEICRVGPGCACDA